MPTPYDPAYIPIANAVMPPVAQQFAAGAGGIIPGTPGSMGLIPPMPQMTMPGLSPYGPAIPGTQSMMPAPVGGQWNQLAQQMAGPMFMPPAPSAGIPQIKPIMPGGGPIATVAPPPSLPTPSLPPPSTVTPGNPGIPAPVRFPGQGLVPMGGGGYRSPYGGRPGIERF